MEGRHRCRRVEPALESRSGCCARSGGCPSSLPQCSLLAAWRSACPRLGLRNAGAHVTPRCLRHAPTRLCAPREMVLLRTWRKDEDGTYIVLYQSTKHRAVREAAGGRWSWRKPVRVQVGRWRGWRRGGGALEPAAAAAAVVLVRQHGRWALIGAYGNAGGGCALCPVGLSRAVPHLSRCCAGLKYPRCSPSGACRRPAAASHHRALPTSPSCPACRRCKLRGSPSRR